jgi:hypothetical protein
LKLTDDVAESVKREKHRIKQLLRSASTTAGLETDIWGLLGQLPVVMQMRKWLPR